MGFQQPVQSVVHYSRSIRSFLITVRVWASEEGFTLPFSIFQLVDLQARAPLDMQRDLRRQASSGIRASSVPGCKPRLLPKFFLAQA